MRTERKLIFDFITAAGLLLQEHFSDRELEEMRDRSESIFLMVETSGLLFKGARCVLKKADGKQEELFALSEREGERE